MATNDIHLSVSDNNVSIPLTISSGRNLRTVTPQNGSPYYVGARAYVTQTENGATVTVIDKDGTTTAVIANGTDGTDGADGTDGVDGVGIVSITKTATVGLVDTYTILFTDGTTTTFEVTNGEDGAGTVQDVTVNGVSVLVDGVAQIDLTGKSDVGHTHTKSAITDFPTAVSSFTNDAGYITGYTETDPVFSASAASGIASSDITSWNGKYTKPSGGIPKTDLASAVQTSLGLADTALQSFTETDPIFTASAASGISSSDIDNWDAKQDELVSGVSIRTINGTSVLGSGDISVAAGGTPIPTADTVAEFDGDAHMNSEDMSAQEVSDFVDNLDAQGANFESMLIDALKSIFVVEFKQFSGTWTANAATTISGSVAKSGYTPIGIVGASTNHGSIVLIRFYVEGTTGYVEGRNTASSAYNASPWVRVLYRKD